MIRIGPKTPQVAKSHITNLPRVETAVTAEISTIGSITNEVDQVLMEGEGEMELARRTRTRAIRLPYRLRT